MAAMGITWAVDSYALLEIDQEQAQQRRMIRVNSGRQNDQEKTETAMSTAMPPAEVAGGTTTSASPLMCVLDTTNSVVGDVPSTTTNVSMSESTLGGAGCVSRPTGPSLVVGDLPRPSGDAPRDY